MSASNVILIGYRGSGKTSIGKKLANQLWKTFVDTDERVRDRFDGRIIADIWETDGEPAFRAAEVAVAEEVCGGCGQVIALGGGTLMQPGVPEAVAGSDAVRIYLRCEARVLHQRIHSDPDTGGSRPSLTALGGGLDEIERVLAEREPTYRASADVEFDVTHTDIDEAVRHLIARHL